ncbi:uncharacterized protein LOC121187619 isoform X2 [Toxotes jaculatrix]|uniref:uncharacterized protein LOC121187619 isoform X2 n=1 Tax=Toxotes jaculatrix TaxID=941984 RepID=UPI001B3B0416|nr:uncharacterized protein LOC121187619 isoform X2 [Toxotes jaculatrix]
MLKMNADKWIFSLAVCFTCVSSNDLQHYNNSCEQYLGFCPKEHKLSAPLGSSVLLPCNFRNNGKNWVSWTHASGVDLVNLTSGGRIEFLHPRRGRVKAFPNQGSKGNYSIRIDELEDSDLGCYRCMDEKDCLQVELVSATDTLREDMWLLIYICVGVAAPVLLIVCSYCEYLPSHTLSGYHCKLLEQRCCCCAGWMNESVFISVLYTIRTKNNTSCPVSVVINEGVHAPTVETGIVPVHEQDGGIDNYNLVYENDDQGPAKQQSDPTRNPCSLPGVPHHLNRTQASQSTCENFPNFNQFNLERAESQTRAQRFHRELFNRLRQASFSRHYYANQRELSQQQAVSAQAERHPRGLRKKKAKQNEEYKNPIYNRGTDQLNYW